MKVFKRKENFYNHLKQVISLYLYTILKTNKDKFNNLTDEVKWVIFELYMLIMCLPPTITFALLYKFLQNTTMIIYTNTILTRSLIILSNQCELCEKKF